MILIIRMPGRGIMYELDTTFFFPAVAGKKSEPWGSKKVLAGVELTDAFCERCGMRFFSTNWEKNDPSTWKNKVLEIWSRNQNTCPFLPPWVGIFFQTAIKKKLSHLTEKGSGQPPATDESEPFELPDRTFFSLSSEKIWAFRIVIKVMIMLLNEIELKPSGVLLDMVFFSQKREKSSGSEWIYDSGRCHI